MSTKYGIFSLGFIGCLGFVVGLFYYINAVAGNHAAVAAGDQTQERVMRMLTGISKILVFGGLALMIISTVCYLLYRKWEKDNHDT